jgi:hypothetical protein
MTADEARALRERLVVLDLLASTLPKEPVEGQRLVEIINLHNAEVAAALDMWAEGRFEDASPHFDRGAALAAEISNTIERLRDMPHP